MDHNTTRRRETIRHNESEIRLSTSTSTFTGTCGFIHGKTCTNRSPVCRYPALKLPTSTGDDFGIVNLLVSTCVELGPHLGARLSRCLKFAARRPAPCLIHPTPHDATAAWAHPHDPPTSHKCHFDGRPGGQAQARPPLWQARACCDMHDGNGKSRRPGGRFPAWDAGERVLAHTALGQRLWKGCRAAGSVAATQTTSRLVAGV